MRVYVLLSFLLAGCANVQVASQSLEEGVSGVIYNITEDKIVSEPEQYVMLPPPPNPFRQPKDEKPGYRIIEFNQKPKTVQYITTAYEYIGFTESSNRKELQSLLGVDPRTVQWCAAFVNSILRENNIDGSESISSTPLMARSFLDWGDPVDHKKDSPQLGDIVIFPRGRASWQGHVGFYVDTVTLDGKEYWRVLGGNQNNSVNIELYDPKKALGVRRKQVILVADKTIFPPIFGNLFRINLT